MLLIVRRQRAPLRSSSATNLLTTSCVGVGVLLETPRGIPRMFSARSSCNLSHFESAMTVRFRGAAVGGEIEAAGGAASRDAAIVACVRAYVRRRQGGRALLSVLCQCCGQRRVLVCLRHV